MTRVQERQAGQDARRRVQWEETGWPGRGNPSRGNPSRGEPTPPTATTMPERLSTRPGLVLVSAAARFRVPEAWGLGLAYRFMGASVTGACLIMADGLSSTDPDAYAELVAWAASTTVSTPKGPVPIEPTTRSDFCDPDTGLLTTTCYTGAGWLVTADEGRSIGLLADHWAAARLRRFQGGFVMGLPGWGAVEAGAWRARLHRPVLYSKAVGGHGLMIEYGRAGRGGRGPNGAPAGHWERVNGSRPMPFRGRFLDLIGPAFGFDGLDCSDLASHCKAFGIESADIGSAVEPGVKAADELLAAASSVHQLAVALDNEACRWAGGVRLSKVYSPASLAEQVWARTGLTAPLTKFKVPNDAALEQWQAACFGGWQTAELQGQILPTVDADIGSAYPAAWSLLDCWEAAKAERIKEADVTEALAALCEQVAAGDLSCLFDPATYRTFGLTIAHVRYEDVPGPVVLTGGRDQPGGFHVVPLHSSEALWRTWPDVVLGAVLSGQAPIIERATRLVPVGAEPVPDDLPVAPGLRVKDGADPMVAAARLRAKAKAAGNDRLARCLRVFVNAGVWGNFARIDQSRRHGALVETPGPRCWPPMAATVPACVRLWLAILERAVTDAGGAIITRDTDGAAILASSDGGAVTLADGTSARVLSWSEVDGALGRFDALDPFGTGASQPGTPFWKVERDHNGTPLAILSLGQKRYVKAIGSEAIRSEAGWSQVDGTVHALGGNAAPPPGWLGSDETDRPIWTVPVAQHALDQAATGDTGPLPFDAPWDHPAEQPFPVIRQLQLRTPKALDSVPGSLGTHPFSYVLDAQPSWFIHMGQQVPCTLDPGDFDTWDEAPWFDNFGPVKVTTTGLPDDDTTVLETVASFAHRWTQPRQVPTPGPVLLDPRLRRRTGRRGVLIDARLADPTAHLSDFTVTYDPGAGGSFVADEVDRLGPTGFARRYEVPISTAKQLSAGRPPGRKTIRKVLARADQPDGRACALDGCNEPVYRSNQRYCTQAHKAKAKRQRQRQRGQA